MEKKWESRMRDVMEMQKTLKEQTESLGEEGRRWDLRMEKVEKSQKAVDARKMALDDERRTLDARGKVLDDRAKGIELKEMDQKDRESGLDRREIYLHERSKGFDEWNEDYEMKASRLDSQIKAVSNMQERNAHFTAELEMKLAGMATFVDGTKAKIDVMGDNLGGVMSQMAHFQLQDNVTEGRVDKRPTSSHSNEPQRKRAHSEGPLRAYFSAPLRRTDTESNVLLRRSEGQAEPAADDRPLSIITGAQAPTSNSQPLINPMQGMTPGSGLDPADLVGADLEVINVWRQINFGVGWGEDESKILLEKFATNQARSDLSRRPQTALDRVANSPSSCLMQDMTKMGSAWPHGPRYRCEKCIKRNRQCFALSWFGGQEPGAYDANFIGKRWTVEVRASYRPEEEAA